MSLLSRLLGRRSVPETPAPTALADRVDVHQGFKAAANADLITGYRFCATMQLRTPLRVLRRHNEEHEGVSSAPPQIAQEMWEGVWLPRLRTFRELGIDVDEISSTMASDIGPIPQDGGDYLKFLIAARTAAEAAGPAGARRSTLASIIAMPEWRETLNKRGGASAVLDYLFPPFIETVPRLPRRAAAALADAGYDTPAAINVASDQELRAVQGIGPKILKTLRTVAAATDSNGRYLDAVRR